MTKETPMTSGKTAAPPVVIPAQAGILGAADAVSIRIQNCPNFRDDVIKFHWKTKRRKS